MNVKKLARLPTSKIRSRLERCRQVFLDHPPIVGIAEAFEQGRLDCVEAARLSRASDQALLLSAGILKCFPGDVAATVAQFLDELERRGEPFFAETAHV